MKRRSTRAPKHIDRTDGYEGGHAARSGARAGVTASSGATVAATVFTPYLRLFSHMPRPEREPLLSALNAILQRVGLSLERIASERHLRVPHAVCIDMLETAVRLSGKPALGLYCAALSEPGDLELFEYLIRSCSSGADAIEIIRRYLPLLIDAEFEVTRERRFSVGTLRFASDVPVTRVMADATMAFIARYAARYLEGPLGPFEVHMAHPRPAYAHEYQRVLGVMPLFGLDHYAFVFSPELERAPSRGKDPVLFAVLKRQADAELEALPRRHLLTRRVRDAIEHALPHGAPLARVARALGYSEATLRRHLEQHGTSYRVLLEQVRRDLAARHLEALQLSISEIAYQLGFAHVPAFHRAFKRWYGRSPSEYRLAFEHRARGLLRAGRQSP